MLSNELDTAMLLAGETRLGLCGEFAHHGVLLVPGLEAAGILGALAMTPLPSPAILCHLFQTLPSLLFYPPLPSLPIPSIPSISACDGSAHCLHDHTLLCLPGASCTPGGRISVHIRHFPYSTGLEPQPYVSSCSAIKQPYNLRT